MTPHKHDPTDNCTYVFIYKVENGPRGWISLSRPDLAQTQKEKLRLLGIVFFCDPETA